ncbi:MAG: hypothetical protein ACREBW_06940 [Candidatus Micrarchaeaceae archaeon]
MMIGGEKHIEGRREILSRLAYDYVATSIANRLMGRSKTGDDVIAMMTNAVPELGAPTIKGLFDVVSYDPSYQPGKESFDRIVADYSSQYGFLDVVLMILDKRSTAELEALLHRITSLGNRYLELVREANEIETRCTHLANILSGINKNMAACTQSLPEGGRMDVEKQIERHKSLIDMLQKISGQFTDFEPGDNANMIRSSIRLAYIKFRDASDLVTDALKKSNDLIRSLEQKNLLRPGDVVQPIAYYHLASEEDLSYLVKSAKKLALRKDHALNV